MANYTDQLTAILEKVKFLEEKKDRLTKKRCSEIADLVEKYNLLSVPDTILSGAFIEIEQAVQLDSTKLQQWEETVKQQTTFQRIKRVCSEEVEENHSTISSNS